MKKELFSIGIIALILALILAAISYFDKNYNATIAWASCCFYIVASLPALDDEDEL